MVSEKILVFFVSNWLPIFNKYFLQSEGIEKNNMKNCEIWHSILFINTYKFYDFKCSEWIRENQFKGEDEKKAVKISNRFFQCQ